MFKLGRLARCLAFVRLIDSEDCSLEGVRYIKIAVSIESKRVGGRKASTAEHDRVLARIRIIYLSNRWRSDGWNRGYVFNFRRISKVGRDPLNLGSAKVADIDLVIPTVKLKPQERRPGKISLRDELPIFVKPQKFIRVGTEIESGHINFFRLGIGGDPFWETHSFWQCNESLRRIPFDNDCSTRP